MWWNSRPLYLRITSNIVNAVVVVIYFSHCGLAAIRELQVKVTRKEGPSGQETELRMLQKGDHFGEKALDKYVMCIAKIPVIVLFLPF